MSSVNSIQYKFLLHANLHFGLWAVHPRKKEVYEFEFKRTSGDLKYGEKKKEKYQCQKIQRQSHPKYTKKYAYNFAREMPRPHRFYYVMPVELWEKEKDYLKKDKHAGVIVWQPRRHYRSNEVIPNSLEFVSVKRVVKRESNLQKFDVVVRNIAARATNVVAYDVLNKKEGQKN